MGHASITVTAHIYADLYGDELDVASALDALDDARGDLQQDHCRMAAGIWPEIGRMTTATTGRMILEYKP
jgi:hypothetical protein